MGSIDEASMLTRTASQSTNSTSTYVAAAESPYRGPSGPSHPYEMYPQRTMSMTTTSTAPVSESSYNGPRAPAHPYGLYVQDTIVEGNSVPPAPIPIGFRGLPDQYQRRVGAEGEEIDIIGPHGHTEQLPPYTRYPDEAYARKVRDAEETSADPVGGMIVPTLAPVQTSGPQAIPGAGGLGLATRNPEFESVDDLGSPRSRHSSRSFTSDSSSSQHEINMAAAAYSEKETPENQWQSWMRRRVCGIIPMWSIVLILLVLTLMSVILGAVIGSFMSKERKGPGKGHQEPSNSSSPTFGVVPIPTPSDLPVLPLGQFSMPLMTGRSLSTCFVETTLAQAWQCHLIISNLRLTIARTDGDYTATITCNTSNTVTNHVYSYGEQPFLLEKPARLELVNDTYDPGRGPAWFKAISYNKTVIVPEGVLSPGNGGDPKNRIRRGPGGKFPMGAADFKRKGIISEGAKPWICNWPETYLELFIYATQNSSLASIKPPQGLAAPAPAAPPPPPPGPSASSSSSTTSTAHPPDWTEGNGPSKYTAASGNTWTGAFPDGPKPTGPGATAPAPPATVTQPPAASTVYGPIDTNDNFTPPPLAYPRVIKLEERHMHGRSSPSCTQVEIQDMGQPAKPIIGPDGKPVVIEIVESPPSLEPDPLSDGLGRRAAPLGYRDASSQTPPGQCGCVWFLT